MAGQADSNDDVGLARAKGTKAVIRKPESSLFRLARVVAYKKLITMRKI